MSDGERLLAYCHDHPEDDDARLVFADWLEEQGDADRAEFVRLQVRQAPLWQGHPDALTSEDREEDLLSANEKRWRAALPTRLRPRASFRRGLPTDFVMGAKQLLERKTARLGVPIHGLELHGNEGSFRDVLDSGLLAGVRDLSLLGERLSDDDVRAMALCPHLAGLRRLDISYTQFGLAACRSLFRSPHLAGLDTLAADGCLPRLLEALAEPATTFRLGEFRMATGEDQRLDLGVVARGPCFQGIERLNLSGNRLSNAKELTNSRALDDLRCFRAAGCGLSTEDISGIFRLGRLELLDLRENRISSAGAGELASSPHMGNLISLSLADNLIGDAGLVSLAHSTGLRSLRCLDFESADVTDDGVSALAHSPLLGRLEAIQFGGNSDASDISEPAIRELISSMTRPTLRSLVCWDLGITSETAAAVADSPNMASLIELALPHNQIGPEGAEALARSPHLRSLRSLDLGDNSIGSRGAEALLDSPLLGRLNWLSLSQNPISRRTRVALRKRRGDRTWNI